MFTRRKSRRQQIADAAREAVDRGAESAAELERYGRQATSDADEVLLESYGGLILGSMG